MLQNIGRAQKAALQEIAVPFFYIQQSGKPPVSNTRSINFNNPGAPAFLRTRAAR